MTNSIPDTTPQPGLILKTAREELSLTIEQVAQELHLRPAVVKAIEEENYGEFDSEVFLKGYFRTYCRLVKLNEDRMVAILEKQLGLIKEESQQSRHQEEQVSISLKRRKRAITGFVFLLCAGLIYAAYYISSGAVNLFSADDVAENHKAQTDLVIPPENIGRDAMDNRNEPPLSAVETTESMLSENDPAQEQSASVDDVSDYPEDQALYSAEEEMPESLPSSVSASDTEMITVVSSETADELSSPSQLRDDSELEDGGAMENETLPSMAQYAGITLSFSGDCWLKLTDGTGKTAIADLKRENEVVNYRGIVPFHIVIGDASKASVTFEGKAVDLTAYSSRNGRAELNLTVNNAQAASE
jgi:cytoskeletal protein RodZ